MRETAKHPIVRSKGGSNGGIKLPGLNAIDKLVSYFDPGAALQRWRNRTALSYLGSLRTGGYVAPGSARRSMRGWQPTASSPDEDVLTTVEDARAACRDIYMNSALGSGALRRIRTNVVGAGLTLQSRIDREFLGLTDDEADAWEEKTEREFACWAESIDCDASRSMDFQEIQGLALLSTLMNGDCFAALPMVTVRNSLCPYKLRIKLIEADLVRNPMNQPDIGKTKGGIELDDMGAPVAYWVMKPALYSYTYTWGTWTKVPAFGSRSGRRNMLHLIDRERIGQRRGMPLLATVLEPLKQITRLTEAELMASVIASFFTVFVKTESGEAGMMDAFTDDESVLDKSGDDTSMGKDATNADDNLYEMGPGTINELGENQSIDIADPKRPNDNYDKFFVSIVKQIAANIEMPYEQLMMVYQASYSASRAALLEAWKFYRMKRAWLVKQLCQPVFEEFMNEAVANGRIVAPGFFNDPLLRKAWLGSAWVGQGQGQIDPVKETNAAILKIKGNLSNYEDEYAMINGGDWKRSTIRLARQNRTLEANNLTPSTGSPEMEDDGTPPGGDGDAEQTGGNGNE